MNEEKQRVLDIRYLRMARIWSENSYCRRRQVGALIVKNQMIISDGYNGTPSGFDNICEDPEGSTFPYVLQAEPSGPQQPPVGRRHTLCDGISLHGVCKTDNPIRYPPRCIL